MGKYLKRLDNHLLRSHKGITRATNDRKPYPSPQAQRAWVKCLFPSCGKQVMHLHNHVKNVHSLEMKDYKLRFATEKPDKPDKSEVAFVNTIDKWDGMKEDGYALEENISGNMRDMNIRKENVESIGGNARKSEHIDGNAIMEDDNMDGTAIMEDDNVDGNALEEDNEGGNIMEDHRTDDLTEEEDSTDGNAREEESPRHTSMRNEGACFIYSREKLRYLVHNSSPDGLRFLLAFMKRHYSLPAFFKTQLCKVFFKNTTLSVLRDIYIYRQHLTSYFRMSQFYPYPSNAMIKNCLACDLTDRGQCRCPVLPEDFYLYCKGACPHSFRCIRCEGDPNRASHKCLDFYHCKRCDFEYKASAKHQPYPETSNQISLL